MKTLLIVNHEKTAEFLQPAKKQYNDENPDDVLEVKALLELPQEWQRGVDRVVLEANMDPKLIAGLAVAIPCAAGWSTINQIVERGPGNDEFFEIALSLYILEYAHHLGIKTPISP